jgi:hypothetical protein
MDSMQNTENRNLIPEANPPHNPARFLYYFPMNKNIIKFLLSLVIVSVFSCGEVEGGFNSSSSQSILNAISETGKYTAKDSVAAYIYLFHKLPSNYVNKATGQTLYENKTGNEFSKWNFNPWTLLGIMIGGDIYYNNEGLLPSENSYQECDVDYHDSSRGTKRLVYTLNGIIYYTANHYESFAKIY